MKYAFVSVLGGLLLLTSMHILAEDLCTGSSNAQACEGPYGLVWKAYSTFDSSSSHYHVIALTSIADAYANEPTGYRVPTIKELVTIAEYDGASFPTIDSWLIGAGFLLSSTYGSTSAGIKTVMALDAVTKDVVELSMTGSSGPYYLLAVHKAGEVISN
jgi:hypothetical protein